MSSDYTKNTNGKNNRRKSYKTNNRHFFLYICLLILLGIMCFAYIQWRVISDSRERIFYSIDNIPSELPTQVDCALVLGAGLNSDNTPSPMLRERLNLSLKLYKAGRVKKILVTGDHGSAYHDEVNAMRIYLEQNDIPPQDIFMDHAGFSTYESMYRAKEIFQVEDCIICTQKYHLYRAVYTANNLGLNSWGYGAENLDIYNMRKNQIREALARVKAFLEVELIKPEPSYKGEVISIDGDGRVTVD